MGKDLELLLRHGVREPALQLAFQAMCLEDWGYFLPLLRRRRPARCGAATTAASAGTRRRAAWRRSPRGITTPPSSRPDAPLVEPHLRRSHEKESPMKLGLALGYSGANPAASRRARAARREPRLRLGVDGGGVRVRRDHAARLPWRRSPTASGWGPVCSSRRVPRHGCHGAEDRRCAGRWRPRHAGVGCRAPQIVEGWYGQPWGKPTARLRDYI